MGSQFHETEYGKQFFEQQLPALTKALERLADARAAGAMLMEEDFTESEPHKAADIVYVCCRKTSPELACENGEEEEMIVETSLNDVYAWIDKSIKEAEGDAYLCLNDYEEFTFYKEVLEGKKTTLTLYAKGEKNSQLYYSLTVKPFTVSLSHE